MSVVGAEFESLKRFNITELYPKADAQENKEETAASTKEELKENAKDEPAEARDD